MFTAKFKTGNAAFKDDPRPEIARILRDMADKIERRGFYEGSARDADGNIIGEFVITFPKGGKS